MNSSASASKRGAGPLGPAIALGPASFLVFFAALAACASGAAEEAVEIERVVVSGTRFERSEVSVPASIEIVTREEIEASGASHVVDVLRGRGGVQVADSFGDGSRAQIGMRGFGETAHANTLVLVDGRRLNNADIGPPDLNSIALEDVERIEVVQGSAGALFGDQAVGGVVNIITRRPRDFSASFDVSAGDHARRSVHARVSDRLANGLGYRLSAERRESANYRDHNALDYSNLSGRLDLEHASGLVFAELQAVEEILELPGGLTAARVAADRRQSDPFFARDQLDTTTRVARAGLEQGIVAHWSLEGEIAHRVANAKGTFFAGPFRSERRQVDTAARLVGVYPNRFGEALITLGSDLRDADFDLQTAFGTARNRQDVAAVYLQAVVPFAPGWSVTGGARRSWVDNRLTDTTFRRGVELDDRVTVAEAGLAWRPSEAWRLYVRRDENFRFAKSDEQSFTIPGVVGLDTQEGVSWEAGVEWRSPRGHSARMVGFRLEQDGEVAFDPTVVGPFSPFIPGANVNLESTLRHGFIVAGSWQATRRLRLGGDFTYTDAKFDSGGLDGNDVPLVAPRVLRLSAEATLTDRLRGWTELQAVDERFLVGDNLNAGPKLAGYAVVNAHLEYRWQRVLLAARVNNVLDNEYVETGSPGSLLPSPERNWLVTLKIELD